MLPAGFSLVSKSGPSGIRYFQAPDNFKDDQPDFVDEWFEEHGTKPVLHIWNCRMTPIQELVKCLRMSTYCQTTFPCFMYHVLNKCRIEFGCVADEDWYSFDQKISQDNRLTHPLRLVRVELEDMPNEHTSGEVQVLDGRETLSLFWSLVAGYRVGRARETARKPYFTMVEKRVRDLFEGNPFKCRSTHLDAAFSISGSMIKDGEFVKIIAALDMFYHRYNKVEWAACRISTMPSRNRGCVVLTSWMDLSTRTSLVPSSLMSYTTMREVHEEMQIALSHPEELDRMDTYARYGTEFGLVRRSAWAGSSCPCTFFWLHVIGCAFGSLRSKNANYLEASRPNTIMVAGLTVGILLDNRTSAEVAFATDMEEFHRMLNLEEQIQRSRREDREIRPGDLKQLATPEGVFSILSAYGAKLPGFLIPEARKLLSSLADSREGTVGKKLYDFILTQ